jgi:signal transduction histidine kinase
MEDVRWPVAWTNRLQRLAAVLSGVADPASMAREAVEQGQAALAADAGVVFLLSSDGSTVEIGHDSGYPEDSIRPWGRFPLSADLPATEAIRNRQTVLVRSRDEMRGRYPEMASLKRTLIHDSWAAVPLAVEGVCIGALGFSFFAAQAFEAPEVAFLQVVADQCAQALQRAHLAERERRSAARLRMLAEASRALAAASLDVGSVLKAMSAQVLAHVGHACTISLASPDGEWLEIATMQDQDPERERLRRQVAGTLRIRRGDGLSGKVLASGNPVLLPSVTPKELGSLAASSFASRVEAVPVYSLMCVPLRSRGRALGTITTARFGEGRPFTADDLSLLGDMADRAALAIENARLHEAEREARARAEDADRRKDEFLAMLGHELRNPLAPMLMAIEILRQLPADEKTQAWARDAIARQVAQLSRLVDDMLDVSRINLGRIELRMEPLDLGAVAVQALEGSRPLLAERDHQVVVEVPVVPVLVSGDAVRLTQAISNLLNNAAKYTNRGGQVRLRVASVGEQAIVTVSDTGIGISAEMLGRVFDLFAQGQEARDRSNGGLGVGLTLVKRLVEMHAGYVQVSSPGEGHGSEFVLAFPRIGVATAAEHNRTPATKRMAARRRVLIADDNVDAAEGLRHFLELQDQEVEVVHDGAAAEKTLSCSEFEVILLDISLPGMDGLEVARRVRSRAAARRPLMVAITGLGRDEDRQRSIAAGFDHHLVKPIDPAQLASLLETAPGP